MYSIHTSITQQGCGEGTDLSTTYGKRRRHFQFHGSRRHVPVSLRCQIAVRMPACTLLRKITVLAFCYTPKNHGPGRKKRMRILHDTRQHERGERICAEFCALRLFAVVRTRCISMRAVQDHECKHPFPSKSTGSTKFHNLAAGSTNTLWH